MLAPVGEKKTPLLRRVLETWLASGFNEVIVVLGRDAAAIRAGLEESLPGGVNREESVAATVRFVENPKWEAGMFSSAKIGLSSASPSSTHIAISPADLPFLSKGSLRRVLSAAASLDAGGSSLAVPTHAGRRGHPLVIPASLRARLLSWPDTARLNLLFEEEDLSVLHLEGFDESILHDVDTPGDLSR